LVHAPNVARPTLNLVIRPNRAVGILGGIAGVLVLANFGVIFFRVGLGYPEVLGLNRLFDLNGEANLPALFSTLLFLINSGLLLLAGGIDRQVDNVSIRHSWTVLASVFLFLAVDENAGIHEMLIKVVKSLRHTGGILYFAWVIPYGVATIFLGGLLWPWFRNLDKRTQRYFGASAMLFISGALGMEMINGRYLESVQFEIVLNYQLMMALEEILEMSGLILFTHSLLAFIQRHRGLNLLVTVPSIQEELTVAVAPEPSRPKPTFE